jgi:RimJ/RimL family protein N-acetyltransferase
VIELAGDRIRAALERLGFVREGVRRRFFPSRDGGIDGAVSALTHDDRQIVRDAWIRTG